MSIKKHPPGRGLTSGKSISMAVREAIQNGNTPPHHNDESFVQSGDLPFEELGEVLANLVDISVSGPLILFEATFVVPHLKKRGIEYSRIICIDPGIQDVQASYPGIHFVMGEAPCDLRESLFKLKPHPASAIISGKSIARQPIEWRQRFLMASHEALHNKGVLIQREEKSERPFELIKPKVKRLVKGMYVIPPPMPFRLAVESHVFVYGFSKAWAKEVDKIPNGGLKLKRTSASEGLIEDERTPKSFEKAASPPADTSELPTHPGKLWTFSFKGKRKGEKDEALISFLEDVYGSFLPAHREKVRRYIFREDRKLYRAIENFGFENLPEHLQMPSTHELVEEDIQSARKGNYRSMEPARQKSVRTAVRREKRAKPTNN